MSLPADPGAPGPNPSDRGSVAARPLVVTRRWDQLGGRLNALTNAIALAEALELEFRFVWPQGPDAAVNDPRQLFAARYLADHEIEPEALSEKTAIWFGELTAAQPDYIAARLSGAGAHGYVDVDLIFEAVRFIGESPGRASERFARCWDAIGWSDEVRALRARCASALRGFDGAGVHVRAGDIVDGDWRHVAREVPPDAVLRARGGRAQRRRAAGPRPLRQRRLSDVARGPLPECPHRSGADPRLRDAARGPSGIRRHPLALALRADHRATRERVQPARGPRRPAAVSPRRRAAHTRGGAAVPHRRDRRPAR